MIHVYHGDGKGKTTAAMGLALRMLAAGRRVVVVQFLKDGESGEVRLLAEHFGVPVFAGKASDKFTWSMTSEELVATRELHDGNLASALAELEGAQEGLLVLDEASTHFRRGLSTRHSWTARSICPRAASKWRSPGAHLPARSWTRPTT